MNIIEIYDSLLTEDMTILKRVEKTLSIWTNGLSEQQLGIAKLDLICRALHYIYSTKREVINNVPSLGTH